MSEYDVAIVGGGPAGSTTGALLKKYDPNLRVLILERETFPRDHVGESLLPPISKVLDEMGCWDKIEAADFPIKIGATYRWGKTPELWDFDFLASELFQEQPRPAKFAGQRQRTAFQVDRSIYDKILLDHASEYGCEVRQATKVKRVLHQEDRVTGFELESGSIVTAKHYVDASGHGGILRRAMGVECEQSNHLQNIAFWDYWQNAEWAVEIGTGGTRIQVMSLDYGWIWFIPLGATRTSVGLVLPVAYYKASGKRPEELYAEALKKDPLIVSLMANARSEGLFQTTTDWSFVAKRIYGENWFLVGESAGFADPILSAGLTMAHLGGRDVACTILEIERGQLETSWLKEQFGLRQAHRVRDHIRFADYWYTANAQFTDLKEFTAEIAKDAGLELTPDKAWAWLGQGGFIDEDLSFGVGGFSLQFLKSSGEFLSELAVESPFDKYNVFELDLAGSEKKERAKFARGAVKKSDCYVRGGKVLPVGDAIDLVLQLLGAEKQIPRIVEICNREAARNRENPAFMDILSRVPIALEAMILDGWVKASFDPSIPLIPMRQSFLTVRWSKEPAGVHPS